MPAAERSPSRPVATGERVLFVGDSVLAAVAADPVARVRLLGRVDGAVEAETCRRLVETSCTVDGRTPDTAIDAIRRRADGGFTVAVVEAGYNDPSIETAIDVVIRELALIGVRRVLWVTYHDGSGRFGGHNAALSSALGRHPSVLSLIEWGAASDRRPEWFAPDRVHLSPGGAQALAEVIAAAMEGGARARA